MQPYNKLMNPLVTYCVGSLLLTTLLNPVYSQEVSSLSDTLSLSVEQVWERTNKNSKQVHSKELANEIRAEQVQDAIRDKWPTLAVFASVQQASNIPIYDQGIFHKPSQHEVIHTLYNTGADMYLNLYSGSKITLAIQEKKLLKKIADIEVDQSKATLRYEASSLFLSLQQSLIFKRVMQENIVEQAHQLKEVKDYFEQGVILKSDILRMDLELSKRRMTLLEIENDIKLITQKLNQLMGLPDEQVIKPMGLGDYMAPVESYEDALQLALHQSYENRLSEKHTEHAALAVKQVKTNLRPVVGMTGNFTFANPQIFLYPYNDSWYSLGMVGLKASYQLSALWHTKHKIAAAKLAYEQEEVNHHYVQDQVRQQLKEAYLRYNEALTRIDVQKKNFAQAKENARIIKNTYFNQTSLITDLLDANLQVLKTQFELESAKIVAQNKYYILQLTKGTL